MRDFVALSMGRCHQAGALGAVTAPWLVYLGQATGAAFVPYVIFGSLCIAAGVAMPSLPETMGVPAAASLQVEAMLMSAGTEDAVCHRMMPSL